MHIKMYGGNQCQIFHQTITILAIKNQKRKKQSSQSGQKKEGKEKREFVTYKYTQNGKEDLHEAIIINGIPFFVKYNHETNNIELVEKIEENTRVIRPPAREEYPYTPYEFGTKQELDQLIEKAKHITKDELYIKCKYLFSIYVDSG